MLDLKNVVVSNLNTNSTPLARFVKMKSLLDTKCAANLRLLATKNNINRTSDYQYLTIPISQSTDAVNGLDYIHPVVKPMVDYATAVISKGLAQNGEINFEFVPDNEADDAAARQATNMVHKLLNQNNNPHFILQHWIMDACLHKNGEMLIAPMREQIVRYVNTTGTADQLLAFEQQAADAGLTALRTKRRKKSVNLEAVVAETKQFMAEADAATAEQMIQGRIDRSRKIAGGDDFQNPVEDFSEDNNIQLQEGEDALDDAITRNTIYDAEYKLTGYTINVKFRPIAQHFWMCDPTVINIQEQPFCGFYKPMSIQEATELYPDIDLEEFKIYAEYSNVGAYQAGSLLNNLAIHARDSVPINGLPAQGYAAQEPEARQVTVLTVWNRYDIDGDGELELIELIYSGQYVISAREVEFIPVANMCPKPLAQNFYGMSIAESVTPMQEYMTSGYRAELMMGLLQSTPRLGVKPDRVDFEMIQDGEAAIFILDSKFDPTRDIYPMPIPQGNPTFMDNTLGRMAQDSMAMIGMTTPQDMFTPEVMSPGNSGAKLQLAMSPNQIIQDNTVKNCAEGLKDAIWLVWRTLIAHADDYGVRKLAQEFNPDGKPVFLDAENFDNMEFNDRHTVTIDLALGMRSEENSLQRLQVIKQAQTGLNQEVAQAIQMGMTSPELFKKMRKPFEDMLYVLGVKDCNAYLLTIEEVTQMAQDAAQKAEAAQKAAMENPNPDDKKKLAGAQLDTVRAQEILANMEGNTAEKQLEGYALLEKGKARAYD
jgi:hypothetical protein